MSMKKVPLAALLSMGAGALAGQAGFAQSESASAGPALEEIVVTARKREESLQDVPLAVTALSAADTSVLSFDMEGVTIRETIRRRDFESWIAPELAQIDAALDRVFAAAGLPPAAVDQVFMTGGSSFVPALRALFEARFGADRLATGDQLQSIASGLALIGLDSDPAHWLAA